MTLLLVHNVKFVSLQSNNQTLKPLQFTRIPLGHSLASNQHLLPRNVYCMYYILNEINAIIFFRFLRFPLIQSVGSLQNSKGNSSLLKNVHQFWQSVWMQVVDLWTAGLQRGHYINPLYIVPPFGYKSLFTDIWNAFMVLWLLFVFQSILSVEEWQEFKHSSTFTSRQASLK